MMLVSDHENIFAPLFCNSVKQLEYMDQANFVRGGFHCVGDLFNSVHIHLTHKKFTPLGDHRL